MDVFALRDRVVAEYRDYVESFITILDPDIERFVRDRLAAQELWPEAVLQLNPAYEPDATLAELAAAGVILPDTARFFGPTLRLHRHQREALDIAHRGEPLIVTTGTGSGKSLTYLLPIVDHVLRHEPARHTVRALIVYPMNALINSQLEALHRFRDRHWPDCPVRFARYTGQEGREEREAILNDPPHLLLTNYVMLEYLLVRPYERVLLEQTTRDLQFLVVDELHVYRGRQGADVAMLLRRVRQRAGNRPLRCIGTSATLATEGDRATRRSRIAAVASTLFGVPVRPECVVDETLKRLVRVPAPATAAELRAAVLLPPPAPSVAEVTTHPLAAWVEETFGLAHEDGRLVRRPPRAFADGLRRLVEETGLDEALCRERLQAVLEAGNRAITHTGEPVFAFRLHQFLSTGGSVFATLEPANRRLLTMEGQYVAPDDRQGGERRLLFPLAFCRECGQEYYLANLVQEPSGARLEPRAPLLYGADDDLPGEAGFFAVERDGLWGDDLEELPEGWLVVRRAGLQVKPEYARHRPRRFWARPDGTLSADAVADGVEGWFVPRPFLLCLRCRAVYDRRESDFRKLATLSQTGRSTATTVLAAAAITELRRAADVEPAARKVLSFTDNRQDASLQAGHLNDFVQVVLLRGALVQALARAGSLTFDRIGPAIADALELTPEQFMREPRASGPGYVQARDALVDLLEYRAFEDLRRAWRVAQPNLEQCGLLRIEYHGLAELAADDTLWQDVPGMSAVDAARREAVLRAVLDHLRGALAIDAACLQRERVQQIARRAAQWLSEAWTLDEHERLREAAVAVLPGVEPDAREAMPLLRLGARSAVGRYLRSRRTWGLAADLDTDAVERLVTAIVDRLRGHLLTVVHHRGAEYGVQIHAGALRWLPGDGRAPGPDPVRARALYLRRPDYLHRSPNRYFERLYRDRARYLLGVLGREHTGQVAVDLRREREEAFRQGRLPLLVCSPTMELGVDIADLAVVHLRNVPPTPASYAQRGGRAGRGGRPALVLTLCSQGNAHDQYFFRRKAEMIGGAVAPPRMDLANEELVRAHLHSVWLAAVGQNLGTSMAVILDLELPDYPLKAEVAAQLALSEDRQRRVIEAFWQVVATDPDITGAPWFSAAWLRDTVRAAPAAFDQVLQRWRELYRAATRQRDAARQRSDAPHASRQEREEARRQEQEAVREVDLLLNRGEVTESDFYPYRYLATEGFLPGYNFPRLPLRALVPLGDRVQAIDRPRFLGLAEFGPRNIIYHEGRKHRVSSCILPAAGLDALLTQARLCKVCSYLHEGTEARVDVCAHCGTALDATTADFPQKLLLQPTVRANRWARISSEEEERVRQGYRLGLYYRFAPGEPLRRVQVRGRDGRVLLEGTYAPRATLWRVNHGWRRTPERDGFTIDRVTGRWLRHDLEEGDDDPGLHATAPEPGVTPYTAESRNLLLLRPLGESAGDEALMKTLGYALLRGIQVVYQVEEQEIEVAYLGQGGHARLLLWESAEGGTGVWEQLVAERDGLAEVATAALRVCHMDPRTGEEEPGWARRCGIACYDCLLSYSNQLDHRYVNRYRVRDLLLALQTAVTEPLANARDYEEQYRWLWERLDPASPLERTFLEYLYRHQLRLPDAAQTRPEPAVAAQPDFYYEREGRPGVCVFVDGPAHDAPERAAHDRAVREELEERGYRVICLRYDRPLPAQVAAYPEVFGPVAPADPPQPNR